MKIKHKHKYNLRYIIPITCIGILGMLSFITIYPSISIHKTYADEGNNNGYVVYDVDNSATNYDLTEDGVVLEWDNRDSDYQTITGSNSEVLYRYNRFRVTAENIKKYQILANIADTANGTNGNKLTGYTNSEYNIPNGYSIDSISDVNGIVGKDLISSTTSQWGYAITIGEVTTTDNLANLTYKAVPSAASSDIGLTDNVTELNNQAFTIAFAANIADDKPAGSYRTNVEVSVVVEPGAIPWDKLVYMQDMSSEACASQTTPAASATTVPTKTLIDSRDTSTSYTIAKLADGNCWMTQNLELVNKTITPTDSDVTSNFTIPVSNLSGFTVSDQNQPKAYLGSYGGYYNWYTVTAGTGNTSIASGNASSSVCPKGWQLPVGKGTTGNQKTFLNLTSASGILNDADGSKKIRSAPFNFYNNGHVYDGYLGGAGLNGTGSYWSSTANTINNAYILYINSIGVGAQESNDRYGGLSVRCVAR